MKVRLTSPSETENVSSLLTAHFFQLNQYFNFDKYKTNKDRITEIVSERINDSNSMYKYLSLVDDQDNFVGFINLMISKNVNEVLVLLLLPDFDNQENAELLLKASIDLFKSANVTRIICEPSINNPGYLAALSKMNTEEILKSLVVEI